MKNFIKKNYKTIIKVIVVFFVLLRIWLMAGANWYLNIESYFDSHLELNSAINIISGNWMGVYDKFILCKNPSYPLFLALLYILHVPYSYGFVALILLASYLFVKSIKPLSSNYIINSVIFIFVLYNPVGYCFEAMYNYRNAIVPWVVLLVISACVGMYLRKDEKISKILPWGILGMISMGFFWLLREDSIWFLPFVIVAMLCSIVYWIIKKYDFKKILQRSFVVAMPLIGIGLFVLIVSAINYNHYGIFATNDRTKTSEAEVLGLLTLIDDGSDLEDDYWVSDGALKLAKKNSKTFAKLNLKAFDNWPKYGDYSIWALRDSLADSGYYKDAAKTNNAYKKIAKELTVAFDKGKLKKKKSIQLSSTSGTYSIKEMFRVLPIGFESFKNHITYNEIIDRVSVETIENSKSEADLLKYESVLGYTLMRSDKELTDIKSDKMMILQNENKKSSLYHNQFISNIILQCYKYTGLVFFILAFIGFIINIVNLIKKHKKSNMFEYFILMLGCLLISYMNSFLVGLWGTGFKLTANDNLFQVYTTAQYIFIAVFEVLGIIYLLDFIKNYKKKVVKKSGKAKI